MKNYLILLALTLLISCQPKSKTFEEAGGLRIHIGIEKTDYSKTTMQEIEKVLLNRVNEVCKHKPHVFHENNNIIIEIPEEADSLFYRDLLTSKGNFGIYETYDLREVYPYLSDVNTALAGSNLLANRDTIKEISEKQFELLNPLFAKLKPSIMQDANGDYFPTDGPLVGFSEAKDTAEVLRMFKEKSDLLPRSLKLKYTYNKIHDENQYALIAIKQSFIHKTAPITGSLIQDAKQEFGQNGAVEVNFSMNEEGAQIWKRLTGENLGRSLAIVLGDKVYSYPMVTMEIPDGRAQIVGNFTVEEAKALAAVLKYNELPAEVFIKKIEYIQK